MWDAGVLAGYGRRGNGCSGAESVKLGVPTRKSNGSQKFDVDVIVVLRIGCVREVYYVANDTF
jgi:hypothetical protein